MERTHYAPVVAGGLLVVTALLVVAAVGVPTGAPQADCDDAPAGTGSASVSVAALPDRATVERQQFDGGAWRLSVPDLGVRVDDVRGRPTVTYKLRANVSGRTLAVASTAILGRCHDTSRIGIEATLLEPDRVDETDSAYDGRLTVTYRGTRDGDRVERELTGGNVTVVVRG